MNYATTTSHSNQVSKQFLLLDESGCNIRAQSLNLSLGALVLPGVNF